MNCKKCGTTNPENSTVCVSCGASLVVEQVENVQQAQQQPQQQVQQQLQTNQVVDATQQTAENKQYKRGCAAQAWADYRASGHWFGRALLMALIMIIPVLNFFVLGYMLSGARHAVRGSVKPYPTSIFTGNNFKNGFFAFVYALIVSLVISLVGLIVGMICGKNAALIGWIVLILFVASFFLMMFVELMVVRAASISFGAGFQLGKVGKAYKTQFGKLFCLNICPALLELAIFVGIFIVFVLIAFLAGASTVNALIALLKNQTTSYVALFSSLGVLAILLIAFEYFTLVLTMVIANVVSRAYGIYVYRYVPEWRAESLQAQPPVQEFVDTMQTVQENAQLQSPVVEPAQPVEVNKPEQLAEPTQPEQPTQETKENLESKL